MGRAVAVRAPRGHFHQCQRLPARTRAWHVLRQPFRATGRRFAYLAVPPAPICTHQCAKAVKLGLHRQCLAQRIRPFVKHAPLESLRLRSRVCAAAAQVGIFSPAARQPAVSAVPRGGT
jgi:hypothetical protein